VQKKNKNRILPCMQHCQRGCADDVEASSTDSSASAGASGPGSGAGASCALGQQVPPQQLQHGQTKEQGPSAEASKSCLIKH
jgi:hypothetical protein